MNLITERTLIREVAARWLNQYPKPETTAFGDTGATYAKLLALDPEHATADEVEAIIGNRSWTQVPACDECEASVAAVVQLGEEPDYESSTAWICATCLAAALALASPPPGESKGRPSATPDKETP